MLAQRVTDAFKTHYHAEPTAVIRAPGRVNLIGEHTDYNDGFVLPMAIDRAVWVALRPTDTPSVRLVAMDFDDEVLTFALDDFERGEMSPVEYVKGMTRALQNAGHALTGWEGVIKGDVPIGAGLSSSAAIEMAVGQAFAVVSGLDIPPVAMARMGQWVENEWLQLRTGIMDQMISANGAAGNALLIDCRSLETENVPLPADTAVAILDTGTRRGLVGSAYNERRQQCEAAAAFYGVPKLRDLSLAVFEERAADLDELPRKRARHVISENARVLQARDVLKAGDAAAFGALMDASHVSMRDDFEISSPALDAMVKHAQAHPASHGARMTGGGFAGCAVALIQADAADDFAAVVGQAYAEETGNTPQIYISQPTGGAGVV